jgi:hypothetical protein
MGLIHSLQLLFKPKYEVETSRYYNEFLKAQDAQKLRPFVQELGDRITTPSAILAVGSSLYTDSFWKERRILNKKDPTLDAAEAYSDIDLVIIPEKANVHLTQLEQSVQEALEKMNFKFTAHDSTLDGVSYFNALAGGDDGKYERVIAPWQNVAYGIHSIQTNLTNGTKVDLILGRNDLLKQTATQKIAEERREKYAFSVLYRRIESK